MSQIGDDDGDELAMIIENIAFVMRVTICTLQKTCRLGGRALQ